MSLLERYIQPGESQLPTVSHTGEIPSGQPTCTITIDGQEVTAIPGEAILRAAQRAGFNVPTLCDDEKLAPAAACRMCLVDIEGQDRPLPSCHVAVEPGMKIVSSSDALFKLRKQNLEYILSDHNAYCMPPCQISCPTHIDIPGYLELMAKGQHVEAARLVKEVLPFPYMLGLVCPKPCQEVCRRGLVEEEIAICQCHGYTGELVMEMDVAPTPFPQKVASGKRVAVVGAGPAGMTAAYYIALNGHAVTVFDMMDKQGGICRYGIPEYRLPKVKLDKELNSLWQLRDTEFKGGKKLGRDFTVDQLLAQGYDAVFLGIGAWSSNSMRVPGEDLPGVIEAINYLRQNAEGDPVPVGKGNRVVVIGGGFTTFDCARTSRRRGARGHQARLLRRSSEDRREERPRRRCGIPAHGPGRAGRIGPAPSGAGRGPELHDRLRHGHPRDRPDPGARLDRARHRRSQEQARDDRHERRAHDRSPGCVRRRRRADGNADGDRVRRAGQARGEGDRSLPRGRRHGAGRGGHRRGRAGARAHRHRAVQARGAAGAYADAAVPRARSV